VKDHDFQADMDAIGRSTQVPVILQTVLLATGMGFAAVARVTDSRWVTCRALDLIDFGLKPGSELEVESTLCHEVRQTQTEIVIDDARNDPVYCTRHAPERHGFRSYISVPIMRADGAIFGTLCAIDPLPHALSDGRVLPMFRLFAKLIGDGLDNDDTLRRAENTVDDQRNLAEAQERFIAILAHDLRNPLSVLNAGFRMMERGGLAPETHKIATLMKGSVQRMSDLIENLLDRARKRQGGGIVVEPELTDALAPALRQIIGEQDAVTPEQQIQADIDLPDRVRCDAPRLAQLLSNLLGNARTHGTYGGEIRVDARVVDGTLTLAVANEGDVILPEHVPSLFEPFSQMKGKNSREGLGLGLFIASEIAKGHGGTLNVGTDAGWTTFTFTMPDAVQGLSLPEGMQLSGRGTLAGGSEIT